LAIKNKKGKKIKHTYRFFGYLVEPCIEIWQYFTFFYFFSSFGAFKKSLNLQPKKIKFCTKKRSAAVGTHQHSSTGVGNTVGWMHGLQMRI
jgi:hypothetical protein